MKNIKISLLLLGLSFALVSCGNAAVLATGETTEMEQLDNESDGAGQTEADAAEEAIKTEEARAFVMEFLQEHTQADFDDAIAKMDDNDDTDEYRIRWKTMFAYGVERYDNINVHIFPIDENIWLIYAEFILIVDGIDDGLSGLSAYVVYRQEDSGMYIDVGYDEKIREKANAYLNSSEFIEMSERIDAEYEAQLQKNPDAVVWIDNAMDAVLEAFKMASLGEELDDDYFDNLRADAKDSAETSQDTSKVPTNIYTVQKGDSLWSIAQSELGDGNKWSIIYKTNRDTIGSDPNMLLIGTTLNLN